MMIGAGAAVERGVGPQAPYKGAPALVVTSDAGIAYSMFGSRSSPSFTTTTVGACGRAPSDRRGPCTCTSSRRICATTRCDGTIVIPAAEGLGARVVAGVTIVVGHYIIVRSAAPSDAPVWEAQRRQLWPEGAADHATEIALFFAGNVAEPAGVLMAQTAAGAIVGFVELATRTDVAGLERERVGYVEGLYLSPEARGHGVVSKLLPASHSWARQQNCTAFASDRAGRVIVDKRFR